jgi:hypothetical protein
MSIKTLIRAGTVLALCATANLGLAQVKLPEASHTNAPPSVTIVAPQEGATFLLKHDIHICALTKDFTDTVAQVEFLAGTNVLGMVTNKPIVWSGKDSGGLRERGFCLTWSNAAPGAYVLTAQAMDASGITVTSPPVDISVVTNLPPLVHITHPRDDAMLLGPTNIMVCASAFDPNGSVVSVEFFEDTTSLGVVTNTGPAWVTNQHGVFPIQQTSYCLTWSNVALGTYTLTAVATDNGGAMSTSAPVQITLVSNLPPLVRIVQPDDDARFYAPAQISICAAAKDPDGTVASVQFFQGTTSLGVVTNGMTLTNKEWDVHTLYCLTWSNVAVGTYTLTAVATDNGGISSTSAPVAVAVVVPPSPQVKIVNPDNGAKYFAPANIYIASVERYFTNPIASVEFLSGTTVLANSNSPSFYWKNVKAGAYTLTAVATDTGGISATSPPVNVTVTTNKPAARR